MKALLTGSTGFLGGYILKDLIDHFDHIYLLIRKQSLQKAKSLFPNEKKISFIVGDLLNMDVIEDAKEYQDIKEEINSIIHIAAFYDIEGNLSECYSHNVIGTQNLLYFAGICPNIDAFHYISTIAVSGSHSGTYYESVLDEGQSFSNSYAETKYFAEFQVQNWDFKKSIRRRIYRLGVIIGNSKTGYIPKVDGPYYFTEFLLQNKDKKDILNSLPAIPIPYNKDSLFPIIPVDHAKYFVIQGIKNGLDDLPLITYHVVGTKLPTIDEFIKDCFKAVGINPKPFPLPNTKLSPHIVELLGIPRELLLYMYSKCIYDQKNFNRDLRGEKLSDYNEYKENIFKPIREKALEGGDG